MSRLLRGLKVSAGLFLVLAACATPAFALNPDALVPELDPGSTASALTLLVGGLLMMKDRYFTK